MKKFIGLLAFTFALTACPPVPPVNPSPDASDAAPAPPPPIADSSTPLPVRDAAPPAPFDAGSDQAAQVCAHLAAIGCVQPTTCAATIRKDQGKLTNFNLPCLLGAMSAATATACGTVSCPSASKK